MEKNPPPEFITPGHGKNTIGPGHYTQTDQFINNIDKRI